MPLVRDHITQENVSLGVPMQRHSSLAKYARDLEDIVKASKSRRRATSIAEMSDDKDYMESNLDDFDRAPQGR